MNLRALVKYNKNLKLIKTETKKTQYAMKSYDMLKVDIRNLKMCVFKENSFLSYSEITSE